MKGDFEQDAQVVKFGKIREQHEDTVFWGKKGRSMMYGYQRKLDFSHFSLYKLYSLLSI